jgi:hypothetical protein
MNRPRGYAGYLVGMLALGAGDDLGYPAPAGVQRYPAFGPLVHLALPSVDRPDGVKLCVLAARPSLTSSRANE